MGKLFESALGASEKQDVSLRQRLREGTGLGLEGLGDSVKRFLQYGKDRAADKTFEVKLLAHMKTVYADMKRIKAAVRKYKQLKANPTELSVSTVARYLEIGDKLISSPNQLMAELKRLEQLLVLYETKVLPNYGRVLKEQMKAIEAYHNGKYDEAISIARSAGAELVPPELRRILTKTNSVHDTMLSEPYLGNVIAVAELHGGKEPQYPSLGADHTKTSQKGVVSIMPFDPKSVSMLIDECIRIYEHVQNLEHAVWDHVSDELYEQIESLFEGKPKDDEHLHVVTTLFHFMDTLTEDYPSHLDYGIDDAFRPIRAVVELCDMSLSRME